MNNIKQAAKVEPNPLLKISAFSIIDIHGSKLHMDKLITQHYHNKIIRPKDGREIRFGEGHLALCRILLILACHELNRLRVSPNINEQNQFLLYLSEESEGLPVITNRSQLRTILGKCTSETIANRRDDLALAGFILRKTNTSRIETSDGHVVETEKGRGNFRLLISKEWLFISSRFSIGSQKSDAGEPSKSQKRIIENQSITDTKNETLQQSLNEETRNYKNKDNSCSKGVPAERKSELTSLITDEMTETGNRTSKSASRNIPKKMKEIIQEVLQTGNGEVAPAASPSSHFDNYNERLKTGNKSEQLTKSELDRYAFLLWKQMYQSLYKNRQFSFITRDTSAKLLRLFLVRMKEENPRRGYKWCFKNLSGCIVMVKFWLAKENRRRRKENLPIFRLYAPTTYLRMDMETACFRKVVDEWLPRFIKLREESFSRNTSLVNYQFAWMKVENLAQKVIDSLQKEGFYAALHQLKIGRETLLRLLEKLQFKQEQKDKFMHSYLSRVYFVREL